MCWMAIRSGDDPTTNVVGDVRRHERGNGHSWGVAVAHDDTIGIWKGVGEMPDGLLDHLPTADVAAALGHTRYATKGDITRENAHPFPIRNSEGDVVAALAHNGTWHDAPRPATSDRCDSYYIAQELQKRYRACKTPDADFEKLVGMTGGYVGETITVLHRDGRAFAYAGRFDITKGDDPQAAQSSSRSGGRRHRRTWTVGFEATPDDVRGHTPTETTGRAGRSYGRGPDRATDQFVSADAGRTYREYQAAKDDYAADGGDDDGDGDDDDYTMVRSSGGERMRRGEVLQL